MNDLEAAQVLGVLTAAWPHYDLPDNTAELWMGMLSELDVADAKTAAKAIIRAEQRFPSLARFIQEAEAARHARRNAEAARYGLPSAHKPAPPPPKLMQATRQLIREQGSKKHWHGGPDPCPVCGGMKQ